MYDSWGEIFCCYGCTNLGGTTTSVRSIYIVFVQIARKISTCALVFEIIDNKRCVEDRFAAGLRLHRNYFHTVRDLAGGNRRWSR
jgi:hypothetical protein